MLTITVNGREERLEVEVLEKLMDTLRNRLHLRGTKEGCREGECGACTVLVDGMPVNSCIYAAMQAQGRQIETIEGLDDALTRSIQDAIVDCGGVQCGYCTPGFVVMITALLRRRSDADEALVREALSGNICRCTGYAGIVDAVQQVVASNAGRAT
ncbi:MAG: (2Fe-2S)-binding protein [Rhodospirillaceae bacterium]|nr:(2Fe-2S)-binding protein [Rhodospirillaceae bacterium]